VTGIDISPDMIAIAKLRNCNARFLVSDYEDRAIPGKFDAAVIHDALHHADEERRVVKNIYDCLSNNAVLITAEPGEGHSRSPDSLQAAKNYGTTEKRLCCGRRECG
jgi:SAM-dependent methyltransferase